jgi:hypothetical protein
VSPLPFVDPGRGRARDVAYRLWKLQRDAVRAEYAAAGVPVAEWRDGEPLAAPDRGGDGIQAPRQARARLTLTAATALGAAALAAYAALDAERLRGLLGAGGAAATSDASHRLRPPAPRASRSRTAAPRRGVRRFFLVRGGTVDQRAPLYGAGFLVVAELAFTAMERRAPGSRELRPLPCES